MSPTISVRFTAANAQYGFGDTTFDRTVTDGIKTDASHAKADLDKQNPVKVQQLSDQERIKQL